MNAEVAIGAVCAAIVLAHLVARPKGWIFEAIAIAAAALTVFLAVKNLTPM